ncbi:MAG: rhomboid family intramembrane serine protease [Bacteroidetes bacterium]|nr:rhomboid family intramembrane serine protease [Bacteroidota bacterium]
MNNLYITDVVKHLIIINVLVFIGTKFLGEPDGDSLSYLIQNASPENFDSLGRLRYAVYYPSSPWFHSYQVVTYMFMHDGKNFLHIFFNMYALYMFGTAVETVWGAKKFLFYYLFTGFGALALQFLVQMIEIHNGAPSWAASVPMLGASGAVFGILAAYGMQFPNSELRLLFPPVTLKAKYFVLIYAGLELGLGLSPFQTGVAHFAHVGGALFGFLLIMFWRKRGERLY